jgi:glycoside/pentoside/hexuronide:cation symporter, GPH family
MVPVDGSASERRDAVVRRRLPVWIRIAYGAGQGGTIIIERVVFVWLYFVWVHGVGATGSPRIAPVVFGLLVLGSRVVDAVTDPLVARWSDGHAGRLGRRRPFLLWSGLPTVVVGVVLFVPQGAGSGWLSALQLGVGLVAFYVLLTLYVVPYLGLLADLSPDPRDRVDLATSSAIYTVVGLAVALIVAPLLLGAAGPIVMAVALGVVALPLVYVPTLIDERHAASPRPSTAPLRAAIGATLANRPFLIVLVATNVLWLGFNLVALNTPVYVTVLAGLDEVAVARYSAVLLGVALLLFPVVNLVTKRLGVRTALLATLVGVGIVLPLVHLTPNPPVGLSPATYLLVVMALGGVVLSGLFVLPLTLVAAVADYGSRRTGQRQEGMYFAVYLFVTKVNVGVSVLLSGVLLQVLGSPLGVQSTGPIAGVGGVAAAWLFRRYPEQEVQRAARHEAVPVVA